MQKTSTKIHTLAERVKSGESEYPSSHELIQEANEFFKRALDSEEGRQLEQGVEYCRAAREDLNFAHKITSEPEVINKKKNELILYQHRLQISIYLSEQRYQKVLEEAASANDLAEVLKENNKFKSKVMAYMSDISRMGKKAKHQLDNIDQLPLTVGLQNLQEQMAAAVTVEDYESAAKFRDKIKELEEDNLFSNNESL